MQQINYLRKSFGNSPVKSSKTKSYNKKNDKIRVSILKFYWSKPILPHGCLPETLIFNGLLKDKDLEIDLTNIWQ